MLTVALVLAALLTGATGSWSPCGLSMLDTLAPSAGARGRRGVVAAACATFAAGALLGGTITFGGWLLGAALPGGTPAAAAWPGGASGTGTLPLVVAVAVLAVGTALDLRGAPVRPQVRRQVPEPWRRHAPLPAAALGYGVLLGIGFTTFVLSASLWALAAATLALGQPALGLTLGLAFGIGRALPVVVLAPLRDRPLGRRATALMLERPGLLRSLRAADAVALALAAGLLAVVGS